MPDSPEPTEAADQTAAQQRAAETLARSVEEVTTPVEASQALDSLEKTAGDLRAEESRLTLARFLCARFAPDRHFTA